MKVIVLGLLALLAVGIVHAGDDWTPPRRDEGTGEFTEEDGQSVEKAQHASEVADSVADKASPEDETKDCKFAEICQDLVLSKCSDLCSHSSDNSKEVTVCTGTLKSCPSGCEALCTPIRGYIHHLSLQHSLATDLEVDAAVSKDKKTTAATHFCKRHHSDMQNFKPNKEDAGKKEPVCK
eukprot:TRINITY_DN996_c0_g1_i3.p1 TRINITY_DN996_c0_g1~~TRINITY_DN996_c0_g1_i3.p1  ORF type:complete len:180 (+),score=49.71 TRINITY_DN996_c0_g1_i3:119-658(+)